MNTSDFPWIPFYTEFAQKLLRYKSDRKALLNWIYENLQSDVLYLHESNKKNLSDIDPFSVYGIFNRRIHVFKRNRIAVKFKNMLGIQADVPKNFNGVPFLNAQKSFFFGFQERRKADDIENLWQLFDQALHSPFQIEDIFNKVASQFSVNINLTIGLYWILPETFLSLESTNRTYLATYGISIDNKIPEFKKYRTIINMIQAKMRNGEIAEKSFPELSYNAYIKNKKESFKMPESAAITTADNSRYQEINTLLRYKKNIILQGAPGTGKTYEIPELVVRLCDCPLPNHDRQSIMEAYDKLVKEGRVAFTTFHPSMDYEEFVEGLKPQTEDGKINYVVANGIFKQLCKKALERSDSDTDQEIRKNPAIWKVSLMSAGDNRIRKDCMDNDRIRIAWDNYGEHLTKETKYSDGGQRELNAFINRMQIGDIVLSCYSSKEIDAIGVIESNYIWDDSLPEYKRLRKVKWLVKGIREDICASNDNKTMTLSTVYQFNSISLDKVLTILRNYKDISATQSVEKPYVLIIDEINRGNLAKIFGELITLLEPDKRLDQSSRLCVTLPYSQESFGVPSNVYIIATMNTADRSLGTVDYALRRRFAFVSMKPHALEGPNFNNELFDKVSALFIQQDETGKFVAADCLSEEFSPADVQIGQSYFLMHDSTGDRTYYRLMYEIIPILREYLRDGIFKTPDQVEKIIGELETEAQKHPKA